MANPKLKVEDRKIQGRKVNRLRKEGILPGNIFGKNVKSQAVKVDLKDFYKVYKEIGETGLLELVIGKKTRPVLVHNVQMDPVTDQALHVDFVQVNLKEKTTANVPVEMVGESPAEKQGLGTVVLYFDEVEVEALPSDFPDKFEIDVSQLEKVDQSIQIKDIKVDKDKVEVKADQEEIVAKVEPQKEEEEEPVPAAGEGEGDQETVQGEEEKENQESEDKENQKGEETKESPQE
jgi:large subunit ribosomal protein L25